MAMLRVNGVTIPVLADTYKQSNMVQGSTIDRRGLDGTCVPDRAWIRRAIAFKTPPLNSDDARAYRMFCLGIGLNLPFDLAAGAAGKGLAVSSGTFTQFTSTNGRQIGTTGVYAPAIGSGSPKYIPGAGALVGMGGCTINWWAQKSATFANAITVGCTTGVANANQLYTKQTTATNVALGHTNTAAAASNLLATPAWGIAASWHMVTAVFRFNPISGLNVRSLYFDGALIASDNPSFTQAQLTAFQLSDYVLVTAPSDAKISDVAVLPYPIGDSIISQHFASLIRMSNLPQVTLDGEAMSEGTGTFYGSAQASSAVYSPLAIAGTWRTDAVQLAISMEEL